MNKLDYGALLRLAKETIVSAGESLTIVATNITANPTQAWKAGTSAPLSQSATGVFLHYESELVDGTLIQRGDQKVIFSALGLSFAPNFVGHILRGTEKWTIVTLKPLNPGGTILIYTAQVRQ